MKNKKYQTIDVTSSLDIVDNSFLYKDKQDIYHLCKVLKYQVKNGADIKGYIHIDRGKK